MHYICLKQQTFSLDDYEIVPIRKEDLNLLKEWRNAQIDILRQNEVLTEESQQNYWRSVLEKSFKQQTPRQILFSFLKGGICIGYGGLTHIDWTARRAEVSFLLNPERTLDSDSYKEEFLNFLKLLRIAAFKDLNFHRLFTETFDIRPSHLEALESFGFKLEGVLRDHVKIAGKYRNALIHGLLRHESL